MAFYVQLLSSSFQPALRVGQRSKVTMREMAISCTFYQGAQTTLAWQVWVQSTWSWKATKDMWAELPQADIPQSFHLHWNSAWKLFLVMDEVERNQRSHMMEDSSHLVQTEICRSVRPANSPEMRKCPSFISSACRTLELDVHFCKISPLWRYNGHHPRLVAKHPARWWFHPVFSLELQQIWLSQRFCSCVM